MAYFWIFPFNIAERSGPRVTETRKAKPGLGAGLLAEEACGVLRLPRDRLGRGAAGPLGAGLEQEFRWERFPEMWSASATLPPPADVGDHCCRWFERWEQTEAREVEALTAPVFGRVTIRMRKSGVDFITDDGSIGETVLILPSKSGQALHQTQFVFRVCLTPPQSAGHVRTRPPKTGGEGERECSCRPGSRVPVFVPPPPAKRT